MVGEGKRFLIYFLPIGIWFLQPRINKITETQGAHEETG